MKYLIHTLVVLCLPLISFSQDITGFWKGNMYNDSTKEFHEYEIMISKENGKYKAYSHTSYLIGGAKYYGVKKINVRIAKDGKIVMQDAKWLELNYIGEQQNKNVIQLNVLDLAASGDQQFMDGQFVTNRSKGFSALTGRLSLKKEDPLTAQTGLKKYLQANSGDNLTAGK